MLDYISYILFFGILIIILIYAYIRIKYGFWVIQPVFHVYDFKYIINPPGIIDDYLPEKNKYTNFKNIDTTIYSELNQIQKQRLVSLIQVNYLRKGENTFMPALKNKTYNINIDGQIIELSGESISFFLKETRRKFATKSLWRSFTQIYPRFLYKVNKIVYIYI